MKLKIVANNKKVTLCYEELRSGDVFLSPTRESVDGGFLHIRCDNRTDSMELCSGILVDFMDKHRVYPVDAELTWRIDQ